MTKLFVALMAVALCTQSFGAGTNKTVYIQFIRGTDRGCTGGTCREVGPKLAKKLSPVFRWKHYWEIDRKKLVINLKKPTKIELPGDRKLELRLTGTDDVEALLYRRTGLVTKGAHHSLNTRMFILGGEEDSRESFFVVVRSDEPSTE